MRSAPTLVAVEDSYKDAMELAGRFLARRERSEKEVRERLASEGFSDEVVARTISRLTELRLVDDEALARSWVVERGTRKGLGERMLRAELERRGVERHFIDEALADLSHSEEDRARATASGLLRKVARKPLTDQYRALTEMLLRRGFSEDAAYAGARAVLPPEGWD